MRTRRRLAGAQQVRCPGLLAGPTTAAARGSTSRCSGGLEPRAVARPCMRLTTIGRSRQVTADHREVLQPVVAERCLPRHVDAVAIARPCGPRRRTPRPRPATGSNRSGIAEQLVQRRRPARCTAAWQPASRIQTSRIRVSWGERLSFDASASASRTSGTPVQAGSPADVRATSARPRSAARRQPCPSTTTASRTSAARRMASNRARCTVVTQIPPVHRALGRRDLGLGRSRPADPPAAGGCPPPAAPAAAVATGSTPSKNAAPRQRSAAHPVDGAVAADPVPLLEDALLDDRLVDVRRHVQARGRLPKRGPGRLTLGRARSTRGVDRHRCHQVRRTLAGCLAKGHARCTFTG